MSESKQSKPVWDGINRRRFIRVNYPFTVHIYLPNFEPISTYTEDISCGGIKVTIKPEIPQASLVGLELYLRLDPIVCKGKVSWVKAKQSEYLEDTIIHDLGIEFSEVKPEDSQLIQKQVEELAKKKQDETES